MAEFPQAGDTVGRYTIGERVGRGAAGSVFRGTVVTSPGEVAVKVIAAEVADLPGYREQFLSLARAVAGVGSAHIVAIDDVGDDRGHLYLATELVTGGDLGTRLQRGPIPLLPALAVAAQIAEALGAAHGSGIIHGNLKPSNVLLGERDGKTHAYLCDFAITQHGDARGDRSGYLAPELTTGAGATVASDLYALGCLLVAAITGRPPYQGTDAEIAAQHRSSEIPHWEETSPLLAHLNEVVRTSMAKDPADRYASAPDFRAAITAALGMVPGIAPEPEASLAELTPEERFPAPPVAAEVKPAEPETPPHEPTPEERFPAPPVPAEAVQAAQPWQPQAPESEPPREVWQPVPHEPGPRVAQAGPGGRVLISSLVALVLVIGVVAGIVLLQSGGGTPKASPQPHGTPTSTLAPTPTPAPSASSSPGATKTCQEGRVIPATQRCGQPYGLPGLHYVFPEIKGNCTSSRVNTDKYWQIVCKIGGANPATITYSTFKTTPIGIQHDAAEYKIAPTTLPSGLIQYGPEQLASGRWHVSLAYLEQHPYGVEVSASSSALAKQLIDSIAVRSPGDFVVE